ncbi:hypothetical protein EMMF5_001173 [Cystobasidiomycetes sp. EMM_F5]
MSQQPTQFTSNQQPVGKKAKRVWLPKYKFIQQQQQQQAQHTKIKAVDDRVSTHDSVLSGAPTESTSATGRLQRDVASAQGTSVAPSVKLVVGERSFILTVFGRSSVSIICQHQSAQPIDVANTTITSAFEPDKKAEHKRLKRQLKNQRRRLVKAEAVAENAQDRQIKPAEQPLHGRSHAGVTGSIHHARSTGATSLSAREESRGNFTQLECSPSAQSSSRSSSRALTFTSRASTSASAAVSSETPSTSAWYEDDDNDDTAVAYRSQSTLNPQILESGLTVSKTTYEAQDTIRSCIGGVNRERNGSDHSIGQAEARKVPHSECTALHGLSAAFASTASSDLRELYNEPGSRTLSRFDTLLRSATAVMTLRISFRPLPGLGKLSRNGTSRWKYRQKCGVVELSLSLDLASQRRSTSSIRPAPSWAPAPDIAVNVHRAQAFRAPAVQSIVHQHSTAEVSVARPPLSRNLSAPAAIQVEETADVTARELLLAHPDAVTVVQASESIVPAFPLAYSSEAPSPSTLAHHFEALSRNVAKYSHPNSGIQPMNALYGSSSTPTIDLPSRDNISLLNVSEQSQLLRQPSHKSGLPAGNPCAALRYGATSSVLSPLYGLQSAQALRNMPSGLIQPYDSPPYSPHDRDRSIAPSSLSSIPPVFISTHSSSYTAYEPQEINGTTYFQPHPLVFSQIPPPEGSYDQDWHGAQMLPQEYGYPYGFSYTPMPLRQDWFYRT